MSDTKKLEHIGFIMDGNRTWARGKWLPQLEWHRRGYNNAENIIDECLALDISYVSFWWLSDDNIRKRSTEEVSYLFDLLTRWIRDLIKKSRKKNIRLYFVGNRELMREDCLSAMCDAEIETHNCTGMKVIFALGYGWQDEIVRTIHALARDGYDMENVSLEDFIGHSDTGIFPSPDLIIRTGGHMRHSGYFLFQSAYSEYAFSQKNWPEFDKNELGRILADFYERTRKFWK